MAAADASSAAHLSVVESLSADAAAKDTRQLAAVGAGRAAPTHTSPSTACAHSSHTLCVCVLQSCVAKGVWTCSTCWWISMQGWAVCMLVSLLHDVGDDGAATGNLFCWAADHSCHTPCLLAWPVCCTLPACCWAAGPHASAGHMHQATHPKPN